MLHCKGISYGCKDGAEARRLNRQPIDAGRFAAFSVAALATFSVAANISHYDMLIFEARAFSN
ncbi:hypothetical protein JIR23_26325 [Bradyrhizobium diazoefficiens]|nr:hypothetical protein [Bradyrhizobium diazoefficiens]QQN67513.1 hypothetical protein JIR23_26325 [Bradyrhizobium diazoefficiens]